MLKEGLSRLYTLYLWGTGLILSPHVVFFFFCLCNFIRVQYNIGV